MTHERQKFRSDMSRPELYTMIDDLQGTIHLMADQIKSGAIVRATPQAHEPDGAGEPVAWLPAEEAPRGVYALIKHRSGEIDVVYKTDNGEPFLETWRYAGTARRGEQAPWPESYIPISRTIGLKVDDASERMRPYVSVNEDAGITEMCIEDCATVTGDEMIVRPLWKMTDQKQIVGFQWWTGSEGDNPAERIRQLEADKAELVNTLACAFDEWEGRNGRLTDPNDPHWSSDAIKLLAKHGGPNAA